MPDRVTIEEALTYNYWMVILKLLDLGVPWDAIHQLEQADIAVILGIHLATEQRKEEQEAAQQRQAAGTMNLKGRR